jgi:hypothetical protein
VFRAQFRLLLVTSQLEVAELRLGEAVDLGRRLRAWRVRREVQRLWDAVESERLRLAPPAWRQADPRTPPTGLRPRELLHPRLRPYVQFDPALQPTGFVYADEVGAGRRAVASLATAGSLISIAVCIAQIVARGISDRPSLVVAEVCALVLSAAAIALSAGPGRMD